MDKNRINKLLAIEFPIIQGGMAWVANHKLAAAVSEAGGLGLIAGGSLPAEEIRQEIKSLRKLTNKPFGVNIMLMSPYAEDIVDMVCQERVPVVTTGAGNPGKYISKLNEAKVKVIPVVPTVSLARRVERLGVDAVIVEGSEAGGHIGDISTMALVPQVADAVKIPIIAAGGIGDGRGFLAAIALGADGVQLGTRFVCSQEADVHINFKEAIVKAKDRDAIVTGRKTGLPVRGLKNKFSRDFLELEKVEDDIMKLEEMNLGRLKLASLEGDVENGSLMAGQISGLIDDIKSCKDIIESIKRGSLETLDRLTSFRDDIYG